MSVFLGNPQLSLSPSRGNTAAASSLELREDRPGGESPTLAPLLSFLETELALSPAAIALGLAQAGDTPSLLPMALWQFGLITLAELEKVFDWLEDQSPGRGA